MTRVKRVRSTASQGPSGDGVAQTSGSEARSEAPQADDAFKPVQSGERKLRLRGPTPQAAPMPKGDQALGQDVEALRAGVNAQGLPRQREQVANDSPAPPPKPEWVQRRDQRVAAFKEGVVDLAAKVGDRIATRFGGDDYTSTLADDGKTYGIVPDNVSATNADKPDLIFVNGAGANLEHAKQAAGRFAEAMGSELELVYNATETRQYEGKPLAQVGATLADWSKDIEQLKDDFHDRGQNPAADTVSEKVLDKLRAGEEVHLAGFSQGNAIIARGLRQARDARLEELTRLYNGDSSRAQQQLEQEFSGVKVANMSGPAQYHDYPAELPRQNYTHAEMKRDAAYTVLGEGADPYRDQEFDQRADYASFDLARKIVWHDLGKVLRKDGDRLRGFFDRVD